MMLKAPAHKNKKRIGRGPGSGNGKTSGRGHKGQNSRSGGGVRLGFEGGQMPLYRRIARRGFSNYPFKVTYDVVNVADLERVFGDGDVITPDVLKAKRLVRSKSLSIKVLGGGELTKKLTVQGLELSKAAQEKVEKAGGAIEELKA
ncbi:MAG: 50S ribosomal protein L15 [Spirochaetaceae bacterium]|nr:MAG: 50S ribosomal protein L15 [Spirochaetaceae bacterium]